MPLGTVVSGILAPERVTVDILIPPRRRSTAPRRRTILPFAVIALDVPAPAACGFDAPAHTPLDPLLLVPVGLAPIELRILSPGIIPLGRLTPAHRPAGKPHNMVRVVVILCGIIGYELVVFVAVLFPVTLRTIAAEPIPLRDVSPSPDVPGIIPPGAT